MLLPILAGSMREEMTKLGINVGYGAPSECSQSDEHSMSDGRYYRLLLEARLEQSAHPWMLEVSAASIVEAYHSRAAAEKTLEEGRSL